MNDLILVLRLLHIVGGVFWVGSIALAVFFVEPTAKAFGVAGERFLAYVLFRMRLLPVLVVAATVTIGAGAGLYWIDSDGLRLEWITTSNGLGFTVGAIAALSAYAIALVVLKPQFDRLATVLDVKPSSDDVAGPLEHLPAMDEPRVRRWSLIQVSLLIFAVAAMATARYLP